MPRQRPDSSTVGQLLVSARDLSEQTNRLSFSGPVTHVYNPLTYAWKGHEEYLRRFGKGTKRVVFLGMNPGPFGMVQTGVPFGEVAAVRDWMGIHVPIEKPALVHPKRPILGFDCHRSEVSGKRLWGLFAKRFGEAENFFREHFVVNYCPLAFCGKTGSNITPDKLPGKERDALMSICNQHLSRVLDVLQPEWLIGVGAFAVERGQSFCEAKNIKIGGILHPSPASPAANSDWPNTVTRQLQQLRVWK
jgi:single-strand selective monofunctional uracil DNA glycosylase